MQKFIFNISILLQFVLILHATQGAPECAKCPEGKKWSECVDCKSFCPGDKCDLKCTPGCVCQNNTQVMIHFGCFSKEVCGKIAVDPKRCPEGAELKKVCRKCSDFCPGHLTKEQCDCTKCEWDCKCLDEKLVFDTVAWKCVAPNKCSSPPKPRT